jgi:hypothetical protein
VAEPPARKPLTGLGNGHDDPIQGDLGKRSQRLLGLERAAAAEPAGPDRLLLAADREQAAVEPLRQQPHRLRRPLPLGHHGEVVAVEVVPELGVIDQLPGEAQDALAAPLRGVAGPVPCLALVLGADGGEHAIAERRLRGEQAPQGGARDLRPLRLFD